MLSAVVGAGAQRCGLCRLPGHRSPRCPIGLEDNIKHTCKSRHVARARPHVSYATTSGISQTTLTSRSFEAGRRVGRAPRSTCRRCRLVCIRSSATFLPLSAVKSRRLRGTSARSPRSSRRTVNDLGSTWRGRISSISPGWMERRQPWPCEWRGAWRRP